MCGWCCRSPTDLISVRLSSLGKAPRTNCERKHMTIIGLAAVSPRRGAARGNVRGCYATC